ncbi:2-(1,2-epoxy-1,2-dihydrophenyl)acetyl-CoA isomerase [Sphingobium sp. OAS761]|uniref:enoyl-CoA hydratase n=1 Tax=Sphingobium sp. OAS761 TaxID=2817901 RepID=UPI0020A15214|nr:enoyl-CoA hydratase [Sphingobium sp. OAS761]MCP1469569.1 2-(1,2-epoxy-1,2-dihydrophenyl)acetyl-CoA isomerase [Sphingobium sp. OAS761]
MKSPILSSLDEGILTLQLNNPEVRNALSQPMGVQLQRELRDAANDPGVRVVVLTGVGEAFCAGADVSKLGVLDPDDKVSAKWAGHPIMSGIEQRSLRIKGNGEVATLLHTMGKPTIAMVRGPAAGAGLSMAVACDFRFASPTATFTSAFSRIGASGDLGCAYYLQQLVGPTKAREILMLSDKIDADEALRIGLVSKVIADDELETGTMAFARRLADGPPIALRYIKANLVAAEDFNMDAYLDQEARNIMRCFQTEDSKEAIQAFKERRAPVFKGI